MAIDPKAYKAAGWQSRTETLTFPELAAAAPKGEEPTWKIRQLSAQELSRVYAAQRKHDWLDAIAEAIGSADLEATREQLEELANARGEKPDPDFIRRWEMIVLGSVEPKVDPDFLRHVAKHHPQVFYHVSNRLIELTGAGASVEKKPGGSSETRKSEAA